MDPCTTIHQTVTHSCCSEQVASISSHRQADKSMHESILNLGLGDETVVDVSLLCLSAAGICDAVLTSSCAPFADDEMKHVDQQKREISLCVDMGPSVKWLREHLTDGVADSVECLQGVDGIDVS